MSAAKHEWTAAEDRAGAACDAYIDHDQACGECDLGVLCPTARELWSAYAKLRTDADNMLTPEEEPR